jgi:subtilisin family serine protease
MYRVCGLDGCYTSDSMRAVQQAVLDEADVVNFSISGGSNPYSDGVSLAFLDAFNAGVLVTPSAGNSGPGANTVAHREPWTLTVGASTSDRHFISTVMLTAGNGDTLELQGATVTAGIDTPTPVVMAADYGDGLCLNPFPAGTFSGEIVVCQRGVIARVAKSYNVAEGGAGGLLLYNPVQQGLATDNHFIPSVHLENDAGDLLVDFMATHTGVTGTFTPGVATMVQGDKMAAFSSRGGPLQTLGISKPDVTAPGVQILAGHTPLPATVEGGLPGQLFQAIQGTSMSAPHAAGSAALLKDLHPDWTPAEIKSALMLTANANHVKEDGVTPADAYDMGSGRIDLSKA